MHRQWGTCRIRRGMRAPTTVHAPQLHGHWGPGEPAMAGGGAAVTDGPAGGAPSVGGRGACVPDAESAAGGGAGLVWRTEALQGSHAAGRAQRGAERCFAPTQPEQRDRTAPPSPRDSCTRLPTSPRNRVPGSRGVPRPQLLAWAAPPEGAPAVTARCVPISESPSPQVPKSPTKSRTATRGAPAVFWEGTETQSRELPCSAGSPFKCTTIKIKPGDGSVPRLHGPRRAHAVATVSVPAALGRARPRGPFRAPAQRLCGRGQDRRWALRTARAARGDAGRARGWARARACLPPRPV